MEERHAKKHRGLTTTDVKRISPWPSRSQRVLGADQAQVECIDIHCPKLPVLVTHRNLAVYRATVELPREPWGVVCAGGLGFSRRSPATSRRA